MKNRILAITLVVCMLVCYIPTAIPAVAADFSMPENPVFLADGELYEFGVGASDSITWTNIGDSLLLSDSGHAIGMGSGLSVVTAVDENGVGLSTPVYVSDTIANYAFADVASASIGDADSFDLTDVTSYEASQADGADSDQWMYVDGNTTAVYGENGLQFFGSASGDAYVRFKINLAEDGNYIAMLPYTPSAVTEVYLAATDADSASDILYTDSRFHVFTTKAGNDASAAAVLEADKVLSLSAGEYYLTFKRVSGESLTLESFKLFRISEKASVASKLSLSCDSDIVLEGASVTVTTDVLPTNLADAAPLYYSNNPEVLSVDENGKVSATSYGKASVYVISKNNPFVSDSVELTVAALADDYQFAALAETFASEYEGMNDLKNTAETSAMLVDNYAGSALVSTSSPFTFVDMGTNCSYNAAAPENGLFLFSVQNSATNTTADRDVVLKIKVTEGGQFLPAMINLFDSTAAGADVYLAPLTATDKTADEYLILEVSNADRPTDSEAEKTTLSSTAINLPAGEYYLSFVKTNDASGEYRYLCVKNFSFYKVGEYIAPNSIEVRAKQGVLLKKGATTALTATTVPAAPYIGITWSSSDENVATVDAQGKVTAKKKGVATITATSTDGSGVCGSTQVLVDATPTYKYEIQDFAVDKGIGLLVNKATTAESTANYGGWAYYTFDGTPTLFATNVPAVPNVISLGKYYAIKVTIAESGTYAAEAVYDTWSSSSDGDVYITPAVINGKDVTSATAFNSDNKLVYIPWNTANGNDLTASSNKTISLDAGEYVLWIKKEASYNNKTYINPETGKLESGNRDRYFFIDAINLYKVMDGTIETIDGAQIRTTGKQGLRFISSIDKSLIDSEKVVSYGTLLIPTEDLDNPEDLVVGYEYSINGNKAAQVEAKKVYAETDKAITFTAVLTDIKPEKYTRAISARAYAITESGSVIYSDVITSRSPYQIAKLIEANPGATASEKAVAAEIIAAVDGK